MCKYVNSEKIVNVLHADPVMAGQIMGGLSDRSDICLERNGEWYCSMPAAMYLCSQLAPDINAFQSVSAIFSEEDVDSEEDKTISYLTDLADEFLRIYDDGKNSGDLKDAWSKAGSTARRMAAVKPDKLTGAYKRIGYNDPSLPPVSGSAKAWAKKMSALAKKKEKETGKSSNDIFHRVYNVMRNTYGIVFEQVKKEQLYSFGLEQNTPMNTFRCIQYDEQLMSIFYAILADIH